jgi:hypothetical protein
LDAVTTVIAVSFFTLLEGARDPSFLSRSISRHFDIQGDSQ